MLKTKELKYIKRKFQTYRWWFCNRDLYKRNDKNYKKYVDVDVRISLLSVLIKDSIVRD